MPQITDSLVNAAPAKALHQLTAPGDTLYCTEDDAPWSAREKALCHSGRVAYTEGIEPVMRNELPGYNSGVMTIVIVLFVIITLNVRHYSTFLKTFAQNLFSVRKRQNVFDDRSTMSETRVLLSLILLLCVSEGILLFSMARMGVYVIDNFRGVAAFTGLAGIYYVLQLAAYRTVGYVFTSPARADMWVKGFNASQSLLGLTLIAPALLALFNPSAVPTLLVISAVLYVISRIIFIYKGFRIFYNNSLALIYFILYLCSLEIIPLLLIYKASISLTFIL